MILLKFQNFLALHACQIIIFNIITYILLLVKNFQKNETKNSKLKKKVNCEVFSCQDWGKNNHHIHILGFHHVTKK